MPRKSDIPLTRHTVRLFAGDLERIKDLHPNISPSTVIRLLVRAHIKKAEGMQK